MRIINYNMSTHYLMVTLHFICTGSGRGEASGGGKDGGGSRDRGVGNKAQVESADARTAKGMHVKRCQYLIAAWLGNSDTIFQEYGMLTCDFGIMHANHVL